MGTEDIARSTLGSAAIRSLAAAMLVAATLTACATGSTIGDGSGGSGGTGSGATGSSTSAKATTGTASTSTMSSMQTSSPSATTDTSSSTGTPCSESPCKLTSPQCGCPSSRMCTIDGSLMRACVPVGTQAMGQACSVGNDCSAGDICLGQTQGSCFKFCSTDAECVSPGGLCLLQLNDGMGGTVPNVTMCSQNCDPSSATSCNVSGLGCQAATDTASNRNYTTCLDAGSGGDSAACPNGPSDCKAGFGCFTAGAQNLCLQWCKMGGVACPQGLTCQGFATPLTIGTSTYGVCN